MNRRSIYFGIILLTLFISCKESQDQNSEGSPADVLNMRWAENEMWDDGLAEVAHYNAERVVYEKPRQFEFVYILVKEDFNKEYNTKTNDYLRNDLFPVMKINKFARIPTENYPYHYLASLFYKRNQPSVLHKMSFSSQEWCGNTFKMFEHTGNNYRYLYSSYWDSEGNGQRKLKDKVWFEDGLSYTLRAVNFSDSLTFEMPVVESQISNKAPEPTIYNARFLVTSDTIGEQPAWKVEVLLGKDKINTYWFATDYPNILLQQENQDGFKLTLKSAEREAYWE